MCFVRIGGTCISSIVSTVNIQPVARPGQLAGERPVPRNRATRKAPMEKKRFRIERFDLSAFSQTQLSSMVKFVQTAGRLVAEANIGSYDEPLADLEAAMADELSAISRVLARIENRLAGELARRKLAESPTVTVTA